MAIEVSTDRYKSAHKTEPRGEGFWEILADDPAKGSYLYSSDGTFPEARERALARFRQYFGVRANIRAELMP